MNPIVTFLLFFFIVIIIVIFLPFLLPLFPLFFVCLFGLLLLIPYNKFFNSDGFDNICGTNVDIPLTKACLKKKIYDHEKIRYKELNIDYQEGIRKKIETGLDQQQEIWSMKPIKEADDYISRTFIQDTIKDIKKMDEQFVNDCVTNYCNNHDGCRKRKACSRSWCVDTCKYWHGNKKWKPLSTNDKNNNTKDRNRILSVYLNDFIEQKLKNVEQLKDDKGFIKRKDEADKERMLLAFCQTWKQASPEANPYIDSLDGMSIKPKIDEWGAAWKGLDDKIRKTPDKKDCMDLEVGSLQKEEELIIEEVEEELATFPEHDMSLAALQGFGEKGEPIGSSVIYEKIKGEVTEVDNLGLITTYPLGYKKISG